VAEGRRGYIFILTLILLALTLAACGAPVPSVTPTTAPVPTATDVPPTATVEPTITPTPLPTNTPVPTPGPGLDDLLQTPAADYLNAALDDAFAAYNDLTNLYPNRAEPWLGLAAVAQRQGDPETALEYLKEATVHEPANFEAWRQYAVLLEQSGEYEAAMGAYRAMIDLVPSDPDLYVARAMAAARLGEAAVAVEDLQMAAQLDPYREAAWVNVAGAAYGGRRYETARDIAGAGLEVYPDSVSLHIQHGLAALSAGEAETALADFDAAVAADETLFSAYRWQGAALAELGRDDEAIAAYQRAGELGASAGAIGGDGPYEAIAYAAGLMARTDSRAAFDYLADQVIRYGQPPPLLFGYALIEYERGNPDAALSRLSSLIALHNYAEAYFWRGRIEAERDEADAAREDLEMYLSLRSAGPTAEKAHALLEEL
jgi:tetratricopeptide (TPR) repeat protein